MVARSRKLLGRERMSASPTLCSVSNSCSPLFGPSSMTFGSAPMNVGEITICLPKTKQFRHRWCP